MAAPLVASTAGLKAASTADQKVESMAGLRADLRVVPTVAMKVESMAGLRAG